jgi:Ankyrin repeats (3 copies)
MTTEQREALRQDTIRWIRSPVFSESMKALHLNPWQLPLALFLSFFHSGGLWPWDVISRTNQLGLATPLMRRRYVKLAQTGKIARGYICRTQAQAAGSRKNHMFAQIIASIGGTTEDDALVESCMEMQETLRLKNSEFAPIQAGAPDEVFRAGKSAYDSGEPGSIFVFNAVLHDAIAIPTQSRPFTVCVVNPNFWPAILPIPFAIAKPYLSKKDFEKPAKAEREAWLEKEYPTWQAAMHYFLKERIKRERREFYDSLDIVQLTDLVVRLNNPALRTAELDAVIFARTGQIEGLKQCLKNGVSPNFKGLLYSAVVTGNTQAVELLLSSGADIHQPVDGAGNTYLHEAALHNQPAAARLLLAKGADPNRETKGGQRPLHYAYERPGERAALVQLLEPLTKFSPPSYNLDELLKMEDQVKAYSALRSAICRDGRFSPAELRVISLDEFIATGWSQGVSGMYWQKRWAIVPCAELMDAINEPIFAEVFRRGIAIIRDYGRKVGGDPFDRKSDYVDLDEETEKKLNSPELEFFNHHFDADQLCRKTMDYVRKNRELFT